MPHLEAYNKENALEIPSGKKRHHLSQKNTDKIPSHVASRLTPPTMTVSSAGWFSFK